MDLGICNNRMSHHDDHSGKDHQFGSSESLFRKFCNKMRGKKQQGFSCQFEQVDTLEKESLVPYSMAISYRYNCLIVGNRNFNYPSVDIFDLASKTHIRSCRVHVTPYYMKIEKINHEEEYLICVHYSNITKYKLHDIVTQDDSTWLWNKELSYISSVAIDYHPTDSLKNVILTCKDSNIAQVSSLNGEELPLITINNLTFSSELYCLELLPNRNIVLFHNETFHILQPQTDGTWSAVSQFGYRLAF